MESSNFAYKLQLRKIKCQDGKDYNLFYYYGRRGNGDLDPIDMENTKIMRKEMGFAKELDILAKSTEITKVTKINERAEKLKAMYDDMIDLIFRYMNKVLYENEPVRAGNGEFRDAKDSYHSLEKAFDICVVPFKKPITEVINTVIETIMPSSITKVAAVEGLKERTAPLEAKKAFIDKAKKTSTK